MDSQQTVPEYEVQRAKIIAANRSRLESLDINLLTTGIGMKKGNLAVDTVNLKSSRPPSLKRNRLRSKKENETLKRSRRLRGQSAVISEDSEVEPKQECCKSRSRLLVDGSGSRDVNAPFTLMSIGVTVLDVGQIHRGAWAHKYWSSGGARYHHAYPVGYKATKHQYGSQYLMEIKAGEFGPIFQVTDMDTNIVFEGDSPTSPWTQVCLAKKPSARISGPLFFGFSDPLTIAAITSMYDERERAASLLGEPAPNANPDPLEQATKEFMTLDGVGELGALALASTKALGGKRHMSILSLAAWVKCKEQNQTDLMQFLLHSSEVPSKVRLWPKWKHIVPRISHQLLAHHTA